MIQNVETYENGVLISVEEVEIPDPPLNSDILSAIASMTPEELAQLKALLGVS